MVQKKNLDLSLFSENQVWGISLAGPVVHCRGLGSIPGQGTKIPQAAWHSQKTKINKQTKIRPGNPILPLFSDDLGGAALP